MTYLIHNLLKHFLFFTFAFLCLGTSLWAQSPDVISYQAVIRDADNALVVGKNIAMRISILQGDANGTAIYVETHSVPSNNQGLVSIAIGSGTRVGGDFSAIDWSKGPYFIKTETDPSGGTYYSITGTSQLMTVPYALHARSVEGITATDIDNLANLSGINTGDQDLSSLATQTALGDSMAYIRREIPDVTELATNQTLTTGLETKVDKNILPDGASPGEMKYWDGTRWVNIAPGATDQLLVFCNGVPQWGPCTLSDVSNPITGKTWMDRNLGATRMATSSTDEAAYGDLYQWGRSADGHQIRTSGTTTTLSSADTPGHGDFILASEGPFDWLSPQNTNLWQGVNGVNNPCPSGYRIPTDAELDAERQSWSSDDATGAFLSPLKLTVGGYRSGSNGTLSSNGSEGLYWSSTVIGNVSKALHFGTDNTFGGYLRANGFSVRCIKE